MTDLNASSATLNTMSLEIVKLIPLSEAFKLNYNAFYANFKYVNFKQYNIKNINSLTKF